MPAPLAVYSDVVDVDPAPGVALLEQAGFAVRVLPTDDPERVAGAAAETDALLVGGYMPVTAELMAALPRLRIVATMSVGTTRSTSMRRAPAESGSRTCRERPPRKSRCTPPRWD